MDEFNENTLKDALEAIFKEDERKFDEWCYDPHSRSTSDPTNPYSFDYNPLGSYMRGYC